MKKNQQSEKQTRKLTANEFVNVANIKNRLLYSKDNKIFAYLRVFPANKELNTTAELQANTNTLVANFKGAINRMVYFSLPRQVDIDGLRSYHEKKYLQEITDQKRKKILGIMVNQDIELATSNTNFEHHHYIKIWADYIGGRDSHAEEQDLLKTLVEYQQFYKAINIKTEILDDTEILKICNLFANGVQAVHEDIRDIYYTKHTAIE